MINRDLPWSVLPCEVRCRPVIGDRRDANGRKRIIVGLSESAESAELKAISAQVQLEHLRDKLIEKAKQLEIQERFSARGSKSEVKPELTQQILEEIAQTFTTVQNTIRGVSNQDTIRGISNHDTIRKAPDQDTRKDGGM